MKFYQNEIDETFHPTHPVRVALIEETTLHFTQTPSHASVCSVPMSHMIEDALDPASIGDIILEAAEVHTLAGAHDQVLDFIMQDDTPGLAAVLELADRLGVGYPTLLPLKPGQTVPDIDRSVPCLDLLDWLVAWRAVPQTRSRWGVARWFRSRSSSLRTRTA